MTETKSVVFDPWMTPGNVVVASSYDTLPLPEDDGLFSEVTRLSWNRDGKLEQGQEDFALSRQLTVDEVVSSLLNGNSLMCNAVLLKFGAADWPVVLARSRQYVQQEPPGPRWDSAAPAGSTEVRAQGGVWLRQLAAHLNRADRISTSLDAQVSAQRQDLDRRARLCA
jgi:hypothetical protein